MRRFVYLIIAVGIAGCGKSGEEDAPAPSPPEPGPGIYAGVFPCDNCPGIKTTLWLRPDGRFLFEQDYEPAGEPAEAALVTRSLGRWNWEPEAAVLVLAGDGPHRLFDLPESTLLQMQTASPIQHELRYRGGKIAFSRTIRATGRVEVSSDGFMFTECLTGYELPLGRSHEYTRFVRQFRSVVSRDDAAMAELEGTIEWDADGNPISFRIHQYFRFLDRRGC